MNALPLSGRAAGDGGHGAGGDFPFIAACHTGEISVHYVILKEYHVSTSIK